MNIYTTDKIRNVVLLGHGGSGKTSLVEAAAYLAGIRVQNVKDGYLNILAETQSFGTSFTLFEPAIGDKINGYFNVGVFKTKASGTSQCTQLQHLTGEINHPAWNSTGTEDGHYLVGDFYDNDTNPTKFVLKNQTTTI